MRSKTIFPTFFLTALLLLVLPGAAVAQSDASSSGIDYVPDVSVTLTTGIADGKLVFIGVGGDIDGAINPDLVFTPGQVVQLTLINGDGTQHDFIAPDVDAATDLISEKGASSITVFQVTEEGTSDYWCSVPGHRAAGMEGRIIVGESTVETVELPSIVRDPTDLPAPLEARDAPVTHDITLTTTELDARLADGTTYRYWTFDDQVPGPFLRVREGDTINVKLHNDPTSTMMHSVDFHAVTGPGGGAVATQTRPGETTEFSFKAIIPGLFVYHCATPMVAHHITNGMYGLILVEPADGLPEVDHEFYVMQGEVYTESAFGKKGAAEFSVQKLLDEQPEYLTFNGAVGALTEEAPLYAGVGDTVRIFFGVGGPNKASSFHVIGEMFDTVYDHGSFSHPPLHDVQTIMVPPGGATAVEFALEVPGRYILVDHALSRMERGLAGYLYAEGEENLEIYHGPDSGAGE